MHKSFSYLLSYMLFAECIGGEIEIIKIEDKILFYTLSLFRIIAVKNMPY